MNFLFAWRYFRSKKSTNAINIIAWIAVTAIAVGTAALIVILSVFNGFEDLVKGLYGDFYAAIKIVPTQEKILHITADQLQKIKTVNHVTACSLIAEEKALLMGNYQTIITVKGVEPNYNKINNIAKYIKNGKFDLGTQESPAIVMGVGIENAAGISIGRSLTPTVLYIPNKNANSFNSADGLNSYNVTPTGTFVIQQDFDIKYAFTNLAFLKYMLNMGADEFSSIELNIDGDENGVKKQLESILGSNYKILTRYEQNQSFYVVMQIEKWVIYGILTLILVVAAFNIIGALTMLVLEKQKDIAVLKAMGADDNRIKNIFLLEGLLLAIIGTSIGLLLALTICWLQSTYHLITLGGSTFIINYYPVKTVYTDYLLVTATVGIIAFGASWITARKSSKSNFSLRT